ncbi:MAG: cysteine peptidase family C39 domain-containing protein [Fimbriimonadaceae bacterium]|jgi:hypothetical protein|nr:cysteine peptidase family C39 domain-containing protein [Fimbriimonadaceae bacterium]
MNNKTKDKSLGKSSLVLVAGTLTLAAVALLTANRVDREKPPQNSVEPDPMYIALEQGRTNEAKSIARDFINQNLANKDPEIQDQVTQRRIALGYLTARDEGYGAAKEVFDHAAKEHKGTEAQDPAYGKLDDQAAYQAVACLQGQGKREEARDALLDFIKERPLSPLVYGAHKRYIQLFRDEDHEAANIALQEAITAQEEHRKAQIAACGPKVIRHYLSLKGLKVPSLDELKVRAATTESGTTLKGMKEAFRASGVEAKGLLTNLVDFLKTTTPFVWLKDDHYLLVITVLPRGVRVYDPFIDDEINMPLNVAPDSHFRATILSLSTQTVSSQTSVN